jgi:hypothetical protein
MPLSGNFKTFNLNSIFQLLSDDQKTGVLTVKNEDKEIRIYIKDGDIIYATGSQKRHRLGQFLKNNDFVSHEQLQAALKKAKSEKKALGTVLIEQNLISAEKLQEIIHQQIEFMIFSLFLWDRGEFEYKDAVLNLKGMIVAHINVISLLLESSRKIDEVSVLKKYIPSDLVVYRMTGNVSDKDEVTLKSTELKILRLVDGQRSLVEVIREGGLDEYSAYKAIYSLLTSGLIESVGVQAKTPTKGSVKKTGAEKQDYLTIIEIYDSVLQGLYRNIEGELGRQAQTIFDQSKQVAACQPHAIFRNYEMNNAVDVNTREICLELESIEDDQNALWLAVGMNREKSPPKLQRRKANGYGEFRHPF